MPTAGLSELRDRLHTLADVAPMKLQKLVEE